MAYRIYATYKGNRELIDETDDKKNAEYLRSEYQLAFGSEWNVTIKQMKGENNGIRKCN